MDLGNFCRLSFPAGGFTHVRILITANTQIKPVNKPVISISVFFMSTFH